MKYLLILAIVLGVLWLLKNKRRLDRDDQPPAPPARKNTPGPPAIATEVVACDVCHVHLPRSEALTGPKGVYCSAAHRQQAGAG